MAHLSDLRAENGTVSYERVQETYEKLLSSINESIISDVKLRKSHSHKYIFEIFTDGSVKIPFSLGLPDDANYVLTVQHLDALKPLLEFRGFRVRCNSYPAQSDNTLLTQVMELTVVYTDTDPEIVQYKQHPDPLNILLGGMGVLTIAGVVASIWYWITPKYKF